MATAIIAARYGPAEFGVYQLALTYLAILDALTLTNGTHLRNHLVNHSEDEGFVVHAWVLNSFVMWFLCSIGILILWVVDDYSPEWLLLFVANGKLLFRGADIVSIVCDARMRSDLAQKVQIVSMGAFNLVRVVLAFLHESLLIVSGAAIFQGILTAGYQATLLKKIRSIARPKYKPGFYWSLVRGGFPLTVMLVLGTVQARIVGILLNYKMGAADYGSFQLVYKLFEPATAIGTILFSANYTTLAHTLKSERGVFRKRFTKISALTIASSLFFSLLMILVPDGLLTRIFGPAYERAFDVMWMGIGVVLSSVLISLSVQLDMLTYRYRLAMLKYFAVIVLYIIVILAMGPVIGLQQAFLLYSVVPPVVVLMGIPLAGGKGHRPRE